VNLALGGIQGMQPGSSFKAFTIAKALEDGYGPDTVYNAGATWTAPGCAGACTVKGGGAGPIDMRAATAGSVNTYFAQLINQVGPNKVAELAHRVGVTRIALNKTYGISLTLGAYEVSPLDMAAGYSVFANHGVKADATPVKKVTLADGTVLEDNTGARGERVLSAPVADWTTDLLTSVIKPSATGERADIGRPAAGKTGSAEKNRAAWFVGYTPQLVAAVWMGNSLRPTSLYNIGCFGVVFGGTIPALTWKRFMGRAMEGQPVVPFPEPGVLPAPTSGIRKGPRQGFPNIVKDCGGPCIMTTELTSPPTTPPDGTPTSSESTTTTDPDAEPTTSTTQPKKGITTTTRR
jgi:penicillin-binding protein 1A